MSSSVMAKRYARALVQLGCEHDRLEDYGRQLERLVQAFAVEPRLGLLLESPSLADEKKTAIIGGVADYLELSQTLRNFIGLLLDKERLRQLAPIGREFRHQADAALGIQRARISSAIALDTTQLGELRDALAGRSGLQVMLEEEIEPELIGGIRVRLGGQVLDGSVRGQLQRMAEILTKG